MSQWENQSLRAFLDSLADTTPVPGGGAVAGVALATAAAVAGMALGYSRHKASLAEFASVHETALTELDRVKEIGLHLATADADAFSRLNRLWKLAADDPERIAEWDAAVAAAIAAPAEIMIEALALLKHVHSWVEATSPMLRSDLAVAAVSAESAARAAAWNVRVNLSSVRDQDTVKRERHDLEDRLRQCETLARAVEEVCSRN